MDRIRKTKRECFLERAFTMKRTLAHLTVLLAGVLTALHAAENSKHLRYATGGSVRLAFDRRPCRIADWP